MADRRSRVSPGRVSGRGPAPSRGGVLETVVTQTSRILRRGGEGAPARRARLLDLASEWLALLSVVRRAGELGDPAGLRARLLDAKARFEQAARAAGISSADIESAGFALVAFTDESVLRSKGAARDAWVARPLQLELYGQNIAGEEFFTRLDRLRREREMRIEALEVSYACLVFGFLGRFGLAGPERLQALLAEIESDIAAVRGAERPALSPHAVRAEALAETSPAGSIPIPLTVAVFALGLVVVWIGFSLVAHLRAGAAAAAIRKLLG